MSAPPAGPPCAGEPLSWLLLERYALAELPEPEVTRVRAHLSTCAACATCAAQVAWPPVIPEAAPPIPVATAPLPWWRRHAAAWATTATLACAAAAFLLLARAPERSTRDTTDIGQTLSGVKGGDVALELVRERNGTITHGADTYASNDRWKVLVTCPVGHVVFWDVTVRDGERGTARFPLAPSGPISCGNHVVLPGAFRLPGTGQAGTPSPVEVCLRLGSDPLPRALPGGVAAAPARDVCASLRPEH